MKPRKKIDPVISPPGFTLIELVITLVILGIVATAFVRPLTKGFLANSLLNQNLNQLRGEFKLNRHQALQTNVMVKMVFNPPSNTFTVYSQHPTQNSWVVDHVFDSLGLEVSIESTTLADNQVIFGTDATPYEDSQSDLPQSIDAPLSTERTITLQHRNGNQKTVTIIPETGYISR